MTPSSTGPNDLRARSVEEIRDGQRRQYWLTDDQAYMAMVLFQSLPGDVLIDTGLFLSHQELIRDLKVPQVASRVPQHRKNQLVSLLDPSPSSP